MPHFEGLGNFFENAGFKGLRTIRSYFPEGFRTIRRYFGRVLALLFFIFHCILSMLWKLTCYFRLFSGRFPENNLLLSRTFLEYNFLVSGTVENLSFQKSCPNPSKPPIVRPQNGQNFVQRLSWAELPLLGWESR